MGYHWGIPEIKNFWVPVLERCRKRLARWKANYLSFGGRITLIKATLSSLPIYYLSSFKIPEGVAAKIERLQSHFLRKGQEESKPHLINWKIMSGGKKHGGLDLGGIVKTNIVLLGKWLWRFSLEQQSLWVVVIWSKFGHASNTWDTFQTSLSSYRSPWKVFLKSYLTFLTNISLGCGNLIRFWSDPWVSRPSLCERFPRLSNLSSLKEVLFPDFVLPPIIRISTPKATQRT